MKIALAQFNPIVGNLAQNARRTVEWACTAAEQGVELIIFPELSIVGYSPHDLLDSSHFIDATEVAVQWVHEHIPDGIGVLLGAPIRNSGRHGKRLFNAAILLEKGVAPVVTHKMLLPTYDIYDEYRYFEPGSRQTAITFHGLRLGVHICEDMWNIAEYSTYHTYDRDPIVELVSQEIDLLINLSASPFSHGRHEMRTRIISEICERHQVPFILVNLVGANTELIFDGDSRVHAADGTLLRVAPSFEESMLIWDTQDVDVDLAVDLAAKHDRIGDLYDALVFGIRDYIQKSSPLERVLIGLSGGIDSAVTAALAVDALGPEQVLGITMPSVYSSEGSVLDSLALAKNLGIECHTIPIEGAVGAFERGLANLFDGHLGGVAEENIQARSRGVILMAASNKLGHMVLTTGNKSEMAMGYATLYGDMSGGLAVLADVFKTDVYLLAEYMNERAGTNLIPRSTIEKPPSAELRPDQRDEDSLPPYPVLDEILGCYIEKRMDVESIALQTGHDPAFIEQILNAVDRNEYKRKQAPPALRVSEKAFGTGRRMPIVARYGRRDVRQMTEDLKQVLA